MASVSSNYMYAWEYRVKSEHRADFERIYGPCGAWVELFKMAEGYIRTELFRDQSDESRFMTVDIWESGAAWLAFRDRFAAQFEELDKKCESMTSSEKELGRFETV